MGESRTQQEAFSGGLVAASIGFSGSSHVNFVQSWLALCIWVELLCPQFCPQLLVRSGCGLFYGFAVSDLREGGKSGEERIGR
jgi:hypothetical protein